MKASALSVPVSLKGRVVLVTGGAGDIGSSIAARAASLGATVVIADNGTSVTGGGQDPEYVTSVAKRLADAHGAVSGRFCDVTSAEQVEAMFADLFERHGNVDVVVAAAGTLRVSPIWESTLDDWRTVVDSHATHTYLVAAAACRRWRANCEQRGGSSCSLITFTAATGLVGRPDLGVTHAAAKGAIAAMTLELAHEMYPYGVTVNAVTAANVRGRMADHVSARVSEEGDPFDGSSPDHAALLSAYLATEDAGWITGQVFRVMGGMIGRYSPWEVKESIDKQDFWSIEEVRLGLRRLHGAYPEYKALQGPHREF
ncbi:SDR family NAD(P)-dependent oxidoreductase [Kitasatospora sp. LaBMicrA B282]|uniref:SDR family NAD(P)-dependent oxidoreductase n=1 Tax=Kitasatospora sp. LaBMicrA B282 TaxID=3420949 RepID=UPI003D0B3955